MKVTELQLQLHHAIDSITDRKKLEAVYTLLKCSESPFVPMSQQEYIDAIEEAKQQMKDGKHMSVEDLEKESENW